MYLRTAIAVMGTVVFVLLLTSISSSSARAEVITRDCKPARVSVVRAPLESVHVRCGLAVDGVDYFAVPNADRALGSQVLHLMSSALVEGRVLQVRFDTTDKSGATYGCEPVNCRPILGLAIK